MPTSEASGIVRDKPRKKGEYHGYGPEGYKPGPLHATRSNLDHIADVKRTLDERAGRIPSPNKRFRST